MNIKKVSVIVPIYNAELYIRECLDSLKAQTFSDYEIVMVNDGSSDSSVEICKSFCKNDDRFVLLNQENAGVCAARNNGVKNSSGGYIAFVDADDKVESDYLEVLYRAVIDAGADIAMCDFYDDSGKEGQVTVTQTIEDKNEMFDLYWGGNL